MRIGRMLGTFALALALWGISFAGQSGLGMARLTGIVRTEAGRPFPSAKVVLRLLQSSGATRREAVAFETKTNKKGVWAYDGLAEGTWEITAFAEGYRSISLQHNLSRLEGNPNVELVLEKLEEFMVGLLERANDLAFRQDYDGAIALYKQYLEWDPESFMVIFSIGDCLMEKGEFGQAIAQFQEFVERTSLDPRDKALTARALARMGECHMKLGDTASAIECWRSSVVMSPIDVEVPYNLGEVYFAQRNAEKAARFYRVASEISPSWAEPHYKLGLVYMSQEKYEKARESFLKLLELEPYSPLAPKAREILKELDMLKK